MDESLLTGFAAATIAILNPLGKIPVWQELTSDLNAKVKIRLAWFLAGIALAILVTFLILGPPLLQALGIDLAVFQVAGGLFVLLTALQMFHKGIGLPDARDEDEHDDETPFGAARRRFRRILVPMAIPMIAGPASITVTMVYGAQADSWQEYAAMVAIMAVLLALLGAVFSISHVIARWLPAEFFMAITRLFGLLLGALAMQFFLEALADCFPAWVTEQSPLLDQEADMKSPAED